MRLPANHGSVSPPVRLVITALIFGISAIGAYAALIHAPWFPRTSSTLRIAFWGMNLLLYLIAPFCWWMPLAWRKAHRLTWLSFNLIARILASQIPAGTRDVPIDEFLFFLGLIVDCLFLISGVLAIHARQKNHLLVENWYFILLAILPAAGVYVSVMVWSSHIAGAVFTEAEKITQGRPDCIASHQRKVENLSQLSGVSLLRARYDIGPGAGFSFPTYSRFYTVLAVQIGDNEQYWNWSFKQGSFVRDANTPEIRLRVEACNPITGKKYYYSEF
jgi:hypothetical protein